MYIIQFGNKPIINRKINKNTFSWHYISVYHIKQQFYNYNKFNIKT